MTECPSTSVWFLVVLGHSDLVIIRKNELTDFSLCIRTCLDDIDVNAEEHPNVDTSNHW